MCIRENILNFNEIQFWWDIIYKPISPKILDKDYIKIVLKNVPSGELDANSWKVWTSTLSKLTDRKGKTLFLPIRQALTGLDYGPSMAHILPLIGIDRVKKRLLGQNV